VRHRAAERGLGRHLGIDVDEVVIARRVGERLDLLLRHVDPRRRPELRSDLDRAHGPKRYAILMTRASGHARTITTCMPLTGLRTKRPRTLAWQGFPAGGFMVVIVTRGDWIAALAAGVGIAVICFLIGLAYRLVSNK
jgi:hypothetical protein